MAKKTARIFEALGSYDMNGKSPSELGQL